MLDPKMAQQFDTRFGKMWAWNNDMAFVKSMRSGRMYEEELFQAHLAPIVAGATVMLDIGAHIGSQAIMSARHNPTCRIIAFEAQEPMFRLLQKNLQENCIPNVDARNVAVGHVCDPAGVGIADFVEDLGVMYPNWTYGGSGMFNLGGIGVCAPTGTHVSAAAPVVPMVSIDSLELPRVDYMKIDVEGCEPLVLLGAQETIKRCKPVILFECTEKRPHQSLLDYFGLGPRDAVPESAQLLRNLGYNSFSALPGYNWLAMVIDPCSHN